MNWLDIVLALLMLFSLIAGLRKGLSREIIGLTASVLAFVLASTLYRAAGSRLAPYIDTQWAASLAGFLVIFFAVLVAGAVLSAVVGGLLKTIGLSPIDRLLGAAFGAARGLLICFGVVTVLIAFFPSKQQGRLPEPVIQSRMAPYLIELSHVVVPLAPRALKESFEQRYRQVKSSWEKES